MSPCSGTWLGPNLGTQASGMTIALSLVWLLQCVLPIVSLLPWSNRQARRISGRLPASCSYTLPI